MKPALLIPALILSTSAGAATLPCDTLQQKIERKLASKSVTGYTLRVEPKGEPADRGKVVGTCNGGINQLVYIRPPLPPKKDC